MCITNRKSCLLLQMHWLIVVHGLERGLDQFSWVLSTVLARKIICLSAAHSEGCGLVVHMQTMQEWNVYVRTSIVETILFLINFENYIYRDLYEYCSFDEESFLNDMLYVFYGQEILKSTVKMETFDW